MARRSTPGDGGALALLLGLFAVGLGGGDGVSPHIAAMGRNPFVDSGFGVSVAGVSLFAFAASVTIFFASR
ncbi:hypothetical protein ACOZ4I_01010 [Haloarcula salina]|uniref:hypothetical protein n=1 Tax=Haloarcula salina TaxID=1429914 RepID=UPI003C6EA7A9